MDLWRGQGVTSEKDRGLSPPAFLFTPAGIQNLGRQNAKRKSLEE